MALLFPVRVVLACLACSALAASPVVYDGKIRDEGNGLSSAYMIPVCLGDNHAVTLEQLPDGSLVAAWFGGESEKASGVAIAVSRLANGSDTWTNRTIVAQRDGYANGNPLLFFDSTTGTLHLWHTQVKADAYFEEFNWGQLVDSTLESPLLATVQSLQQNKLDDREPEDMPEGHPESWERSRFGVVLGGQFYEVA